MIFAVVNVTDTIHKDADAKENQVLNDTYVRFLDNTGHPIFLGTTTRMISYHVDTNAKNLSRVSSVIPDVGTHMSTIARV